MASENRYILPESAPSFDVVIGYVRSVIRRLIGLTAGAVWIAFWGLVARLHYVLGDFLSMVVVVVLFVLPGIIGTGYYLLNAYPRERIR